MLFVNATVLSTKLLCEQAGTMTKLQTSKREELKHAETSAGECGCGLPGAYTTTSGSAAASRRKEDSLLGPCPQEGHARSPRALRR